MPGKFSVTACWIVIILKSNLKSLVWVFKLQDEELIMLELRSMISRLSISSCSQHDFYSVQPVAQGSRFVCVVSLIEATEESAPCRAQFQPQSVKALTELPVDFRFFFFKETILNYFISLSLTFSLYPQFSKGFLDTYHVSTIILGPLALENELGAPLPRWCTVQGRGAQRGHEWLKIKEADTLAA